MSKNKLTIVAFIISIIGLAILLNVYNYIFEPQELGDGIIGAIGMLMGGICGILSMIFSIKVIKNNESKRSWEKSLVILAILINIILILVFLFLIYSFIAGIFF